MRNLYLDIETIPVQNAELRTEMMKPQLDFYSAKEMGLKAELEQVKPPANYKDPAKIAEWEKNERPKKEEGLRAQIVNCQAEAVMPALSCSRRSFSALTRLVIGSRAVVAA